MTDPPSQTDHGSASIPCLGCNAIIEATDRFCKHCGKVQTQAAHPASSRHQAPWYYQPRWIVILAVTVLGPMALPLVFLSPAVSRPNKWLLSVLIVIGTVLAGIVVWLAARSLLDLWQGIQKELKA